MVKRGRTSEVPRREAKVLLAKAVEFMAMARLADKAEEHDASLLMSVHAAIASNDAICVALLGLRSSEPDHERAVDLLESAAHLEEGVGTRVRQLRSLLEQKTPIAYTARRATASEARDGIRRALRFVEWAEQVVARARV